MAQSAAQLANILPHRLTPERARALRQKAAPALRIYNDKRAADHAAKLSKAAKIRLTGHQVARLVHDFSLRDSQRLHDVRSLEARVDALSKPLSRADYRRAILERNLGRATVEPPTSRPRKRMPEANPTPITRTDEPTMVEPLGFAPRSRKV